MKIESCYLGDHDVLDALTMFIDEVKERGFWHMSDMEDVITKDTNIPDFFRSVGDELGADEISHQCSVFVNEHPVDEWKVFILWKKNEVAGVIAFADYQ